MKSKLKMKNKTFNASVLETANISIPRFGVIHTKVVKSKKCYNRKASKKIED